MAKVAQALRQAGSMLVLTHARPDCDGLGSMRALVAAARSAGKTAWMLVPDKLPPRQAWLFDDEKPAAAEQFAELAGRAELIVIVDTCAFKQLDGLEDAMRSNQDKIVVIDHHRTSDEIGDVQWMDDTAAATGVMVYELLASLGWELTGDIAEALAAAVTTDTGWLRFANTDARALRTVASLVEAGVRLDELYRRMYQTDRPHRLRLMVRMLEELELHCDDRLAVMTIRREDFEQTGARPDETENLINEAFRMDNVLAAVLLVEYSECVRVSLRSRDVIDVAAIAEAFGGGGHKRAAGLRATEDIDTTRKKLISVLQNAIEENT